MTIDELYEASELAEERETWAERLRMVEKSPAVNVRFDLSFGDDFDLDLAGDLLKAFKADLAARIARIDTRLAALGVTVAEDAA